MRILAALANDFRLQVRYGLYAVTGAMIVIWGVLLGAAARAVPLSPALLLPPFVLANVIITTFYFMAALVLFEKSEGVLPALVVTPLRAGEYLLSKALSLTLLATAETLLIAALLFREPVAWPRVIAGSFLLAFFFACAGFITVARYRSINEMLVPSGVVVMLLTLPMLSHFALVPRVFLLPHPGEPAMWLMREGGLLAAAGALFWCAAAFAIALRAFRRFVVQA